MTLEELLAHDPKMIGWTQVYPFISSKGIENVTTQELNKIIEITNGEIFGLESFVNIYNIVSANETNNQMAKWTKVTMICTVAVTAFTLLNLILFTLDFFNVIK